MSTITEEDKARFWSKVNRTSEEGCWFWTAALSKGKNSYGDFRIKTKTYKAHRIAFLLGNSDYILGKRGGHVLHTCNVMHCVNPSHLVLQPGGNYSKPTELDRARFKSKISPVPTERGCLLWQDGTNKEGYGKFHFGGKSYSAHRLALMLDNPTAFNNRGDKTHACHSCDVPGCCNPEHLFWGSNADNIQDMVSKNRASRQRGSASGMSKLTDADVLNIKARIARNDKLSDISKKYGVDPSTISSIKREVSWKHIILPTNVIEDVYSTSGGCG